MKKVIFCLMTFLCLHGWGQNNVPVSSLPVADTLGSPDFYPVVQGGHYKKVDVGVISTQLDSVINSKVTPASNGIANSNGILQLGGPIIQNTAITFPSLDGDTVRWLASDTFLVVPGPQAVVSGAGFQDNFGNICAIVDLTPVHRARSSLVVGNPTTFGNVFIIDSTAITQQGNLQIPGGAQQNYFLSCDSNGNATWQQVDLDSATLAQNVWEIGGNYAAGLGYAPHFGTRDTVDLTFIVNNDQSGHIWYNMDNLSFGRESLNNRPSGDNNSAFGASALNQCTSGAANTGVGINSDYSTTTGNGNTGIGAYVLTDNNVGSYNTACGYGSLQANYSGNYNSAFGYDANISYDSINNATAIGTNAIAAESYAIVLGSTTSPLYVGIGTSTPHAMLDVEPTSYQAGEVGFKLADGSQGAGKVLTSDASGNAGWATPTITAAQLTTLYPSLPQYASDAAAGTGGLTSGQPYVNSITFALSFKQ